MTYEGAIFVELADKGVSGCRSVVGADGCKWGHFGSASCGTLSLSHSLCLRQFCLTNRTAAQRQAHQDRSQGGQPFALRDISNGRSGCSEDALSGNPWPDQAVAFFDNTCEAGMMCGTAENQVSKWRATVAVYQNSRKRWLLDTSVQLFWRFLRENPL